MSAPTPDLTPSPRLQRPGWRDPRLIIGVALVVLSVIGTVFLVRSLDQRQPYWIAKNDVAPGRALTADDFTVAELNLTELPDTYWKAEEALPETFSVVATVRQGELLSKASVQEAAQDQRQQTAVRVDEALPETIQVGSVVDVLIAAAKEGTHGYEPSSLAVERVEVAQISTSSSSFGSGDESTVFLLLPPAQIPHVLDAQANGAKIHIVPAKLDG